jgi:prefoldin subunit 5
MANPIVQQINAELESLQKELEQFKSTVEYLNLAEGHVKKAVQTVNHAEAHFNKKVEELKATYDSFIKLTDAVSKVVAKIDTVNFPDRLDKIEKTVKETIAYLNETRKATLEELQKASEIIVKADFDGRFKKLQNTIDASVKSNEALANTIEKQKLPEKLEGFEKSVTKKLDSSIADLQKNTKQIATETAKSIHDLNLPVRMDKLDANIAGILSAIQNVQGRIESVERNISDKLKEAAEKQAALISNLEEKGNQNFSDTQRQMVFNAKMQQTNTYITWGLIVISFIVISILIKF